MTRQYCVVLMLMMGKWAVCYDKTELCVGVMTMCNLL